MGPNATPAPLFNSTLIADIIKSKLPHATLLELIKLEKDQPVDTQTPADTLAPELVTQAK